MRIRLFAFLALLYIILLAAFVYHIVDNEIFSLDFFGLNLSLPVVIWFILPVILLFVFALLHISFYTFLRYLKVKNFYSEARNFQIFIQDIFLEKKIKPSFKIKEFQNAAELMQAFKNKEQLPNNERLNEILELLNNLEEQKVVNLKKFKLASDNILVQLNEKNTILSDINYAFARIKHKKELHNELDELAFERVLEFGTYKQIQGLNLHKSAFQVFELFKRFHKGLLALNNEEFEALLSSVLLSEDQYLSIAKMSVKKFNPDSLLALFHKLKEQNSEALRAYLYLLAEFGIFDELRLELKKHPKNCDEFELILLARDHHKKINLDKLIQ